jgi:DNA polymerase-3 subunit delta'
VRWFEAIRGHAHAKEVLARAVERERVPPALLITGRDGTGRFLVAKELARALNCRSDGDVRPCGVCLPCTKIESGSHPDFIRVTLEEGKSEVSIAQVRGLLDELALAPVEGKKRVFVIDPADLMNDFGQDALLKALEEPPARSHLILIARHEAALLRTIASRCFVLALGELEPDEVKAVVEKKGVESKEAALRAAWSGGSPGVALRPQHVERITCARAFIEALASGEARKNPLLVAGDLIAKAAPKNSEPALRREGALEITDILGRVLRDALERAVGAQTPIRSGAADALVAKLAQAGPDRIASAIDTVQKIEEAIANNQNVNLALEGLVLETSHALTPEVALGRH